MFRPRTTVSIVALLSACGLAAAGEPVIEVIYTKVPTLPNSIVPGALDLAGQPAQTRFRALEDLVLSPDGSRWILKARTQQGPDLENIMLMGSGVSGTMFVQEGQPMPGSTDPAELVDFFGSSVGRFDELNRFAFSARARGGVASVAQKIIVWDGANFSIPFHMGSPLIGLIDAGVNPSGDELFGNSVGSIHLLNSGRIGSHDSTIQNIHSTRRPAIFYDNVAFKQSNVSTVGALDGVGIEILADFDANKFYTTPDGAHYIAQGRIVASSDRDAVLVTEDRVVIQEGQPLAPGSSIIVASIVETHLAASGDWYSRGTSATGVWAVKNGIPVAATGDPILPGSTEHWAGSFIAFTGNSNGDWILIGTTDNPDPTRDTVAVLNGERIVAREGDQLDLDGDGIADDAFIGRGNPSLSAFEPNDAALTNDLMFYFIASIRDGAGNDLNSDPAFTSPQAFMRLNLAQGGPTCAADWDASGSVNSADISAFLSSWLSSLNNGDLNADFDQSGTVNSADISAFLNQWLADLSGGNC